MSLATQDPYKLYDERLASEQATLGGMMLSRDAIGDVVGILNTDDFVAPKHGAIYDAILYLDNQGDPTDPIAVSAELDRRGELARIGTADYLHSLVAMVPTAANADYYAEEVRKAAEARRMAQAGMRIQQLGEAGAQGGDIATLLDAAQAELDHVVDRRQGSAFSTWSEMRAKVLSSIDDVQAGRVEPGLPSGFIDLDELTGGWKPGQLIVVAGRPGMGKSTLALDMFRHTVVKNGRNAAFFSLEMSDTELSTKLLCAQAKVRLGSVMHQGKLTIDDFERLNKAAQTIEDGGELIVDDTAETTLAEIRAKARRMRARHGLDLVVVDYLQLLTSGRRAESRQVEVSEFSRGLKILAKELEVPVIALSQLNRGAEQRADKTPVLSDLRESGALEQDADIVLMVNRPEMYEGRDSPRAGEADLILAKHRGGPTGTIVIGHQLHYSRFVDLAQS